MLTFEYSCLSLNYKMSCNQRSCGVNPALSNGFRVLFRVFRMWGIVREIAAMRKKTDHPTSLFHDCILKSLTLPSPVAWNYLHMYNI